MKTFKEGSTHLLRIDRGEDLVSSVTGYCEAAAVRSVEIGYYDLAAKQYRRRRPDGIFELISLSGNITAVDGKAFMHAHVVLGAQDFSVLGGHLFAAEVAVTGEIFLMEMPLGLTRKMNDDVGLKLIE
jgi:predicted DNA-binding protein with PD1-like motif